MSNHESDSGNSSSEPVLPGSESSPTGESGEPPVPLGETSRTRENEAEVSEEAGELVVEETVEIPTDTSVGWDVPEDKPTEEPTGAHETVTDDGEPEPEAAPDTDETEEDTEEVPEHIRELSERYGMPAAFFLRAEHDPFYADMLRRKGIEWGAKHTIIDPEATHILRPVTAENLARVNEQHNTKITQESIRFARLEAGRGNLRPADRLQGLGVDLGIARLQPPDPVIKNDEIGRWRLKTVEKIKTQIRKHPGELRASLRRPGELPLGLHRLPFGLGREVGMRITAWRIARKEIRDRPVRLAEVRTELAELNRLKTTREMIPSEKEDLDNLNQEMEDLQERHDDGLLGIGLPKYRQYRGYIRRLNESIISQRKQLSLPDRHTLAGAEADTKRENLAYRIMDGQASVRWLKKLVIIDRDEPGAIHDHGRFKKSSRVFHDTLNKQQLH